jgi:hypothetical protein
MGTFAHNGDPCCDASNWDVKAPYAAGKTSDPATFNPVKLNTTQWMESITGLGANIAILTAKHGCGFCLWPTKAKLPDGSPYGYSVGSEKSAIKYDVLAEFVASAKAAGVGYGFYYSIMKSFYLCHSFSGTNSCMKNVLPGQHNYTNTQYTDVVKTQVTELWTNYGNLTEIWVDSGLGGLGELMDELQPQAVGTPRSPTDWCGTESGHPSRDVGNKSVWSIGTSRQGLQSNATKWVPKFCDPQLFQEHVWFWYASPARPPPAQLSDSKCMHMCLTRCCSRCGFGGAIREPNLKVRTLAMMIPIYHDIGTYRPPLCGVHTRYRQGLP